MDWQDATCYLNGEWQPLASAKVSVLDRGFIFGDGVYEVIPVDTVEPGLRAPFRAREHFARLERSLAAVRIDNPLTMDGWLGLLAALIERHAWPRQTVYLQVTRGVAKRDHAFPTGVRPTVFAVSSPWPPIPAENLERGVACVTHADERWLHCDVKSISLLGNVLMKQHAVDHGAFETVLFRDGLLTEASSANVFAVRRGTIVVPSKSNLILPGITYDAVLDIARAHGVEVEVRPVAESEVRTADELWLSSSGREVLPVTRLDGEPIGDGAPGPLFRRMHAWFQQAKREDALRWKSLLPALKLAA
ncbi:MAG: D-amino acid aminotransferase [Burkholderiaceae bacterium]|nr:D-amino acid aminotransferase [Burkholderiaceae bacterium]